MKSMITFFSVLFSMTIALARGGAIIPGRFIISVQEQHNPSALAAEHGIRPDFIYSKAFHGFAGSISEAARAGLLRDSRIIRIEQDRIITAHESQSNPIWSLDRIDQRQLPFDGIYTFFARGTGIKAYIIDSGIRYDHQEFSGRAVFGFDAFGGNGSDCHGHGTHVAGTVGGRTFGVAKNVQLISVRVLDCAGSGSNSSVIAGVDWIASNRVGASVANLSLGGGTSSALDTSVKNLIASGVTAIVAAGNDNADACLYSPARASAAITVAASNSNDTKASFSNWGNCVDWFAPGASITSASSSSPTGSSVMSGTSMAAPHVAGTAALYLENNPTATPTAVREFLFSQTTKSIIASANTANNHQLYSKFSNTSTGDTTVPAVSITSPTDGATVNRRTYVTIQASASDNVAVVKVEFYVNNSITCTASVANFSCSWYVPRVIGASYKLQAKAYDATGNSTWSSPVTVTAR